MIRRFRSGGLSREYHGDAMLNSIGDWLAAIIGFKLCWWLQKTYSKPWARRAAIWSFLLSEGILILYHTIAWSWSGYSSCAIQNGLYNFKRRKRGHAFCLLLRAQSMCRRHWAEQKRILVISKKRTKTTCTLQRAHCMVAYPTFFISTSSFANLYCHIPPCF